MISNELLERYHISIAKFEREPLTGYQTFLIQTDYVACKIIEAQYMGTTLNEDYTEVLQARAYAREQIRLLEVTNG